MTTKLTSERIKGFTQTKLTPVKRTGLSYDQTHKFAVRVLKICLFVYRRLQASDQTARLIRDTIEFVLRRYHGYCIKENFGGHYREVGLKLGEKTDFEHVIPAAIARDLLIYDHITINEALNIPTCIISRKKHKLLNKKLASTTPDIDYFWTRYKSLNIKIETHDGVVVNQATWNIDQHYKHFNIT
jgi:hypothetical protein